MNLKEKEKKVKELYEKYPYPSRINTSEKKLKHIAFWTAKTINENNSFWVNKKILELGCGTGELSNALALCGGKVTSIDFSKNSLKKARELTKKLGIKNKPIFLEKNILEIKKNEFNQKFDVVIALGSLHHTINPKKGFSIGATQLKKNGLIIIGLYNKYSRASHRIKRIIVRIIAGNDIEKRIKIGSKFIKNAPKERIADKFGQLHESYHSINEVLRWFSEKEIDFINSHPVFKNPVIDEINWLIRKKNSFFVMSGRKK